MKRISAPVGVLGRMGSKGTVDATALLNNSFARLWVASPGALISYWRGLVTETGRLVDALAARFYALKGRCREF